MIEIIADVPNYVGEAVYGTVGAIIGTFGGAWLVYRFGQHRVHSVRDLAVSAINEIKSFAKGENTYQDAEKSFNSKFNEAQKRAILSAIYKVGIPVLIPEDGVIDFSSVLFKEIKIDASYLDDVIRNIKLGHCDKYFYEDIHSCLSSDFKIHAIRRIGIRFVDEVLSQSREDNGVIQYPDRWFLKFTFGERQTIAVLMEHLVDKFYFEHGLPKEEQMKKIKNEINTGIWDTLLQWNHIAHTNMKLQNENMQLQKENIQLQKENLQLQNQTARVMLQLMCQGSNVNSAPIIQAEKSKKD